MAKPVCAVVGVGPGNGAAFSRKFASEGYQVALLARSEAFLKSLEQEIPNAKAFKCDVTKVDEIEHAFARIKSEMGTVEVLIYNAGAGAFNSVDETTVEDFERAWRINALGCLVAVQQVIPEMRAAKKGNIIIIGATASWSGKAGFLPFASAKAAQRSLAQSLARHLGPVKVHVSYVIIDAVVDLERTREIFPNKPTDFFIKSEDIADAVYFLCQQRKSAWTFELDLRPYKEKW